MYEKIVVGIDESYTETGIAIIADGKLIHAYGIKFKKCKNKIEKRNMLKSELIKIFNKIQGKSKSIVVIIERIRTFSNNKLRPAYLISTGGLYATIADTSYSYGYEVYTVDTRAWKSKVVGTCKHDGDPKLPTINFIILKGWEKYIKYMNKKGIVGYNDNIADAICIGLYGFCDKTTLKILD